MKPFPSSRVLNGEPRQIGPGSPSCHTSSSGVVNTTSTGSSCQPQLLGTSYFTAPGLDPCRAAMWKEPMGVSGLQSTWCGPPSSLPGASPSPKVQGLVLLGAPRAPQTHFYHTAARRRCVSHGTARAPCDKGGEKVTDESNPSLTCTLARIRISPDRTA